MKTLVAVGRWGSSIFIIVLPIIYFYALNLTFHPRRRRRIVQSKGISK